MRALSHHCQSSAVCNHSLLRFTLSIGPVQGCAAFNEFKEFLSAMERDLGSALDWRRAAFWRERRFSAAWEALWCRIKDLPRSRGSFREDVAKLLLEKAGCASYARPDTYISSYLHCNACLAAWLPLHWGDSDAWW